MQPDQAEGRQALRRRRASVGLLAIALPLLAVLSSCGLPTPAEAQSGEVVIDFGYGSEKQSWIAEATRRYNAANHQVNGRRVVVKPSPLGSNELIEDVITGNKRWHLVCPASTASIELGNAEWRSKEKLSGGKDLIGPTESLVVSPVVIAMWRPMAEALGWPDKEIGWSDILKLATDPKGWASVEHAEFGSFKLGHTHPEYSNSGLNSLLAEVYAGAEKAEGLTLDDIRKPSTLEFVRGIERAVVHYGSSTGFFSKSMFNNGPTYLSAAVLYESSVVESYNRSLYPPSDLYDRDQFPVVAIYPREGTFLSDHPIGVVERDWVRPEHRAAAADYVKFLRSHDQQELALGFGFRPSEPLPGEDGVPLAAPIDKARGVDPARPRFHLPVPGVAEMNAIRQELWPRCKKHSQVVFVLDVSTSMQQPPDKIVNAKRAAEQAVRMLDDEDTFSLMVFGDQPAWVFKDVAIKDSRQMAIDRIKSLVVGGNTAMFDAIREAQQHVQANPKPDAIRAIVVLSDGLNNISGKSRLLNPNDNDKLLDELIARIRVDSEQTTTRVFTIYYGTDANKDHMKRIAQETRAESFEGNPSTILDVLKKKIVPFFD